MGHRSREHLVHRRAPRGWMEKPPRPRRLVSGLRPPSPELLVVRIYLYIYIYVCIRLFHELPSFWSTQSPQKSHFCIALQIPGSPNTTKLYFEASRCPAGCRLTTEIMQQLPDTTSKKLLRSCQSSCRDLPCNLLLENMRYDNVAKNCRYGMLCHHTQLSKRLKGLPQAATFGRSPGHCLSSHTAAAPTKRFQLPTPLLHVTTALALVFVTFY